MEIHYTLFLLFLFFFFQAEDGIRDIGVTGVQTCALPIYLVAYLRIISPRGDKAPMQHLKLPLPLSVYYGCDFLSRGDVVASVHRRGGTHRSGIALLRRSPGSSKCTCHTWLSTSSPLVQMASESIVREQGKKPLASLVTSGSCLAT